MLDSEQPPDTADEARAGKLRASGQVSGLVRAVMNQKHPSPP